MTEKGLDLIINSSFLYLIYHSGGPPGSLVSSSYLFHKKMFLFTCDLHK